MHDLIHKIQRMGSPRIALLGDFMLDCYIYGDAERISPEAPVPVLSVVRRETRTGGAANVASAITALGGRVDCVGLVGDDAPGRELVTLLRQVGADGSGLIADADRPTSIKTRYVGLAQHRHAQQMIRIDSESTDGPGTVAAGKLDEACKAAIDRCDLVAIEDYDKGVCSAGSTPGLIARATAAGKAVIVDPARAVTDYARYRGATLLTPNRYETELASGVRITDDASLEAAAAAMVEAAQADGVLITLDREGAYLYARDSGGRRIPTRPRSVYDVTGAGDEVLAALSMALADGWDRADAAMLANIAGGVEVERFGVVPVTRQELIDELGSMLGLRGSKVVSRGELADRVARRKASGEVVAFTNGCFDLLHMGHVRYLQQAREMGSCLVVAINGDHSVRRLKGQSRPIIGQNERAEMLAALECVDYVTVFDEDTPIPLLEAIKPDILIKGGSTPVVVGRELVESYGGRVETMELVEGLSTTSIIERILANDGR